MAIRCCPASTSMPRPAAAAATWRAKRYASASPTRALFATVTTDASCGAVNGMHDSFTPLGGMVPMVNIMLARSSSAALAQECTGC